MRKIEQETIQAIRDRKEYWHKANMEVETNTDNEGYTVVSVMLHGHTIMEISDSIILISDCGYQTSTTKSRLNAILSELIPGQASVYQKNFEWFLVANGETREMFKENIYAIGR